MSVTSPDSTILHEHMGSDIPHANAMEHMDLLAAKVRSGDHDGQRLITLEHAPVVTLGRETLPHHVAALDPAIPQIPVNRGGQATYHGPGILVGYIVLDLKLRGNRQPDLHAFLRAIEQGLMDYVSRAWGLPCVRKTGFTGVWTHGLPGHESDAPRKIAAIGIGCRRWVTTHGFALNFHPDLDVFRSFVPCGITDADTSSILGEHVRAAQRYNPRPMKELASEVHPFLVKALADEGWLSSHPGSVGA